MYWTCASKAVDAVVGTGCSSVVWSQAKDLTLENLTVANTVPDSVGSGTHQAVAVRASGDRTTLRHVHLVSRQDTVYLDTPSATTVSRMQVRDSLIEGDTDFVFGRASVVFDHDEFRLVSTRKANGVIFAPSTAPSWPYGFLVTHSRLMTDGGSTTGHFARAWDAGAGSTGYLPGTSPNGQLLIRDSEIGTGFDLTAPYQPAATTSRPFTANVEAARDLNDPNYNRIYEFRTRSASPTS
jgi:pectinesterase